MTLLLSRSRALLLVISLFLPIPKLSPALLCPSLAQAEVATIQDIIVTNSKTDLLLYFNVANCFTPAMEEGIHNGIPAIFTFYVHLDQIKNGWFNHQDATHTFQHILTHDNLREEYQVEFSEKPGNKIHTQSFAEAKRLMAEISGFKVLPLKGLTNDALYRLSAKAKLARITLPLYFHYLVPFISLWDFETDWHTVEFRY